MKIGIVLGCISAALTGIVCPVLSQETNSLQVKSDQDTLSLDKSARGMMEIPPRISKPSLDRFFNPEDIRRIHNSAFQVGEYLTFDIMYGIIKAGTATMSIPDTQWVNERPCYHIVTTAESSPFFSTFYRVEDTLESLIDTEGIFPWRFEKHLREGKYRADRYVDFDQYNLRAITNKDTLLTPPFVQGALSVFYFARTMPMEVGKVLSIDTYSDGKLYPLKVIIHRREEIRVPAGRFNCIVVEPMLEGEGIFNQTGRITIWLTDDDRRIPVLVRSKVFVGSIAIRLKAMQ